MTRLFASCRQSSLGCRGVGDIVEGSRAAKGAGGHKDAAGLQDIDGGIVGGGSQPQLGHGQCPR